MRPPRLVSLADYERFASARRASPDGVVSEMLRVLDQFLPQLALRQAFLNSRTAADLEAAGLTVPAIETYNERIVDYYIQTNWGRSGLAPANGKVQPPQRIRRHTHPVQDLHGHPTGKGPGEAAPFEPPR
jgi:hypothetical protein